ncbi:hypothetical protein V5O48_010172, partial [Marasmius crinis-equi]
MKPLPVLLGLLTDPFIKRDANSLLFTGDVEQWRASMEHEFEINGIWEMHRTEYAIDKGLEQTPEVQTAMKYRMGNYTSLSDGQVWPWTDFVHDLAQVHAEAQKLQPQSLSIASVDLNIPDVLSEAKKAIEAGVGDFLNSLIAGGIGGAIDPRDFVPKLPDHMPGLDEIYQHIELWLDGARHDLERLYTEEKPKLEDLLKAVHGFIQVQIELLPGQVRHAIQEFRTFKSEHPYIVAGATIALVAVGTHFILPHAFLAVLRLLGFSEIGPVAGTWASAIQSAFWKGHTSGLFSILQSISMTGQMFWPVQVLTDITTIATSALVVMPPDEIKRAVEGWAHETPFPVDMHGIIVSDELETWMKIMGEKMQEAQVPHVQWFDVAIEALRKRLEDLS